MEKVLGMDIEAQIAAEKEFYERAKEPVTVKVTLTQGMIDVIDHLRTACDPTQSRSTIIRCMLSKAWFEFRQDELDTKELLLWKDAHGY